MTGKNRIMICGPKDDGTCREALAISVPRVEAAVFKYFQARMPYGLFGPDVSARIRASVRFYCGLPAEAGSLKSGRSSRKTW
jgi:hypothetical protein